MRVAVIRVADQKRSCRPWVVFSSSSGVTFQMLWASLSDEFRSQFNGFFSDRECGAIRLAQGFLPTQQTHLFEKNHFEEFYLDWQKKSHPSEAPLIFLCGFFGILSSHFLSECRAPVVNTHPSLLPAFPGLDKKVNELAYRSASISGFTVHLVNETLDGGPILFQHPVLLNPLEDVEINRNKVRKAEQSYLPVFLERILKSSIQDTDRSVESIDIRKKHHFFCETFVDVKKSERTG